MEKWITRSVAALVAFGGLGLFWTFGVFAAVPWRENRLLAWSGTETQVLAVSLIAGLAVVWGAQHLLAIADANDHPRLFRGLRLTLLLACLLAVFRGGVWTMANLG